MSISGLITKLKDCRPKVIISLTLHITIIGLAAPTRGRVFSTLVVILSFILSVCPNFFNLSVDLKT